MDGEIVVGGELGVGAEFIVSIPMEVSLELTTLIEETDFDLKMDDLDINSFEFIIGNVHQSFGI